MYVWKWILLFTSTKYEQWIEQMVSYWYLIVVDYCLRPKLVIA